MQIKAKQSSIDMPEKTEVKDLADKLNLKAPHEALAADVNGKICDLSTPLAEGDEVDFFHFDDPKGKEVFWHTSAHVLAQAILRLFPKAQPTIGPPIENGFYYDFDHLQISEDDFPKIEKEIKNILSENFKPQKEVFESKEAALKAFGSNPYKKELIEALPANTPITAYRQGEFFDLCRGPHLHALGKIKAFKLLKTSGAYWRGDSKNAMLTRIYGISFPDRESLKKHLFLLKEAKKRDHRVIGNQLDLFSFHEEAPSMPFIHPKGMVIWDNLLRYWNELHKQNGYKVIKTPQLMSKELWEISGHWEHYRENMFICPVGEEKKLAIKPMSCPGCMMYYKSRTHSYREFPLRIGEVGHVYRKEPSGALNGLFRVQSFHQDDAHIFMTQEQIKSEILNVLALVKEIYETFGLKYTFELSTRPEKSIGTKKDWDIATAGLKSALDEWSEPYKINEGDGAFYGPKIDLHVQDAIGRSWQCGTVQLDFSLPERFDLHYKDSDGSLKRPIMIHRALYGSIERFLGILIEHFKGKFPLWISPLPIKILPISDRHIEYAETLSEKLFAAGFITEVDTSKESISKKVRAAQLLQINYMLTVGDQEVSNKNASLRTRDNYLHGEIEVDQFIKNLEIERNERALTTSYQKPS